MESLAVRAYIQDLEIRRIDADRKYEQKNKKEGFCGSWF